MYNIVDAIYQMLGNQAKIADDDDENPKERVDRIFEQLDKVSQFSDTLSFQFNHTVFQYLLLFRCYQTIAHRFSHTTDKRHKFVFDLK